MYSHAIRHDVLIGAQLYGEYFHMQEVQYYVPLILLFLHFFSRPIFSSPCATKSLMQVFPTCGPTRNPVFLTGHPDKFVTSPFDRGSGQAR